jgi:hypothetical protein
MKVVVVAVLAALSVAMAPSPALAAPQRDCTGRNAEGRPCDDGLFCTVGDRCAAGVCVGEERPCEAAVGFCQVATCDEARDSCVSAPRETGCVDRCNTNQLRKFYRRGWQRGHAAVSRDWDRRGENCRRAEDFIELVIERVEGAQRQGDSDVNQKAHRRCRGAGVLDGAYAALATIQTLCDQVCFLDGEMVGTIAAATYCEMAMDADGPLDAAEWVRGPLDACGFSYETACDGSFIGESIDYDGTAGACAPFTTGVHETPWHNTRERACDYRDAP